VKRFAILVAVGVLLLPAGCHRADHPAQTGASLRGGTLQVAMQFPPGLLHPYRPTFALDPQVETTLAAVELFRCCLLRTLYSYNGRPTAGGGAIPRPDLADGNPTISADGLTWTFRLKRGLHYAPPFQHVEVHAGDIVRAIERELRLPREDAYWAQYLTVIAGASAFHAGRADHVSGLAATDAHTLVVRLTRRDGDLPYRLALPATAPIPPGADAGHEDGYGPFLVSSGPYMIAGSERLNFSLSPGRQRPAIGSPFRYDEDANRIELRKPQLLTLVRNPSWRPAGDALRPAYPDRIVLRSAGTPEAAAKSVDRGSIDLVLSDLGSPEGQVARYRRTRVLRARLHISAANSVDGIVMNLAVPPFDDVHVRKALNIALDKSAAIRALLRNAGPVGSEFGVVTGHILPDSLENDLLLAFDPYGSADEQGDIDAAKAEMAGSRYDRDGDGRCDVSACSHVLTSGFAPDLYPGHRALERPAIRALRTLGIDPELKALPFRGAVDLVGHPKKHVALDLAFGWLSDYPSGSGFLPLITTSPKSAVNDDLSLLGASPRQLRGWGYTVRSVPHIDEKVSECLALVGGAQVSCWAEADQLLMERVVPFVPIDRLVVPTTVSKRVAAFSFDQSLAITALDRIALRPQYR
jgi:peptide/nickel transport system substrate-binding protein